MEVGSKGVAYVLYLFLGNAMVDQPKEPVCFGGVDELGCDLVDSGLEVMEGDLGDAAVGVLGWCHCCTC